LRFEAVGHDRLSGEGEFHPSYSQRPQPVGPRDQFHVRVRCDPAQPLRHGPGLRRNLDTGPQVGREVAVVIGVHAAKALLFVETVEVEVKRRAVEEGHLIRGRLEPRIREEDLQSPVDVLVAAAAFQVQPNQPGG